MTSAYLTELRQRLGVTRDRLDEELRKVPVDYPKAAIYERQIKGLREDIRSCSTSGDLGKVVFGVTAEHGEFPSFEFELSTTNNEVLVDDIEKRLGWHNPPIRLKTVNNVPASTRPGNMTLAADFKDGDRLELVADIAPGHAYFDAYPRPFKGFTKGLPWSWIRSSSQASTIDVQSGIGRNIAGSGRDCADSIVQFLIMDCQACIWEGLIAERSRIMRCIVWTSCYVMYVMLHSHSVSLPIAVPHAGSNFIVATLQAAQVVV